MRILFFITAGCWLLSPAAAFAESPPLAPLFPADVRAHAEKALGALVMTTDDARFEKDFGKPKWALGWVTNTLNDPWRLPGAAEQIHAAATSDDASDLWSVAGSLMEIGEASTPGAGNSHAALDMSVELDPALAEALRDFLTETFACHDRLLIALGDLSGDEKAYLAASVASPAFDTSLNEGARAVLEQTGIPRAAQVKAEDESDLLDGTDAALAWLALMKKVRRADLHAAAIRLHAAASALGHHALTITNWPARSVTIPTPLGDLVIGTPGPDRHDGAALLVLDPGGDDAYFHPVGSANGLAGRDLAVIVDLSGDDRYTSDALLAPGGALFGIAVLIDAAGDDTYAADFTGTANALFGAAWVEDAGGADQYRSRAFAQGAATAGFGMLVDRAGNDRYEVGYYGQGFAGVMGWGLLLDRAGHDVYFAGNAMKDSDRNEDRFLSLSQGFSIGARPHAGGGVGSLVDLAGNDTYLADVYGQGVSYYYSAGFLLDAAGNDRYTMYEYGQGCGIHFSLGLLADAAGNDLYTGFILAQGAAHDYSVGMMFEHAGNDTYTADHHAQGRALNNAFALLVDRAGDDGYFGRQRDGTQGIGNEGGFRDYGSLALLLDLAGKDNYSGGFTNGGIAIRPLYGVVYDHEEAAGE